MSCLTPWQFPALFLHSSVTITTNYIPVFFSFSPLFFLYFFRLSQPLVAVLIPNIHILIFPSSPMPYRFFSHPLVPPLSLYFSSFSFYTTTLLFSAVFLPSNILNYLLLPLLISLHYAFSFRRCLLLSFFIPHFPSFHSELSAFSFLFSYFAIKIY